MDTDWRLRLAALHRVEALVRRSGGLLTRNDLTEGFEFEGERIRLWDPYRGIWRPKQLGRDGAALTIVTAPERPGRPRPYDDQVASDTGWFVYRYERTDPDLWTNVAVRRAFHERRPLIYLYGIAPGLYEAIYPCYVVADDPGALAFHIVADSTGAALGPSRGTDVELAARREYATTAPKVRVHQRKFRQLVVSAYRATCTVCRIRHIELLDAAHILPDKDERGRPEVPNGLALCKIHHAAYDADILGIDPDCQVRIRTDVLEEEDGPMLKHGLQEMEGVRIVVPRSRVLRPRLEYLEERFARFRAA